MKTKHLNLGLMLCLVLVSLLAASPASAQSASVDIWHDPGEPSIYDWVYFGVLEWDNGMQCRWNFGDGTTSSDCYIDGTKRYNQDGVYTVSVDVVFPNGSTASDTEIVPVITHDVAIAKFAVPQKAASGQTKQLTVYVSNVRYTERVQVELYKLVNTDLEWVGTQIQTIQPRNKTIAFPFNYTFTKEDARTGKATFRAMAFILDNGGDDWPADNDIISLPIRVTK